MTQTDNSVLEYNTKEEIEISGHKKTEKNTQTNNTPIMHGDLAEDVGYDESFTMCQQILDETYISPPLVLTNILQHILKR